MPLCTPYMCSRTALRIWLAESKAVTRKELRECEQLSGMPHSNEGEMPGSQYVVMRELYYRMDKTAEIISTSRVSFLVIG